MFFQVFPEIMQSIILCLQFLPIYRVTQHLGMNSDRLGNDLEGFFEGGDDLIVCLRVLILGEPG